MIKQKLVEDLQKVVGELGFVKPTDVEIYISQKESFGDYSTNIALQLAKQKSANGQHSSQDIANGIVEKMKGFDYLKKIDVAGGGFINFFVDVKFISQGVEEILKLGNKFGKNEIGKGQKIQVEFISANPTGPLTLGNGRGGSIGDALSNVLEFCGYQIDREYYVNDTGNQVRLLGESVKAAAGIIPKSEDHYQGEYVQDLSEQFKDQLKRDSLDLGHILVDYLMENDIKPSLKSLGINFSEFYSERSLYQRGLVDKALNLLKAKDLAYDQDGAVWFRSTKFGDEKDRVLVTSKTSRGDEQPTPIKSGPTYFLADIAHHLDVLSRGYIKRINVLGADHHGYGKRIQGAMEALGYKNKVDIILMQLVKLFQDGKEMRMSKRAGTYITIDELLSHISGDAARFFFLMYEPNTQINFDLNLAKEQSNKNPVFYVQYAHARMFGILSKAGGNFKEFDSKLLTHPAELNLIKHLLTFPDLVEEVAQNYSVHQLTGYSIKLADLFHRFYESCPVLNADSKELKAARLKLVDASKLILKTTLGLIGVSAPDRM
ncbi:arginine--tRNA ligase [Candidatus Daviesbacteria bacterium]|nr:arginine--tRNA ligase [Candidatus Daviesbacteria bacterium]